MGNWDSTACILCECNCGIEVELGGDDGRQFVRIRGDKKHPASQGYACEKAHRLNFYQNAPERLTKPLRRRPDGTFEEIEWDTAIREVAERLAKVRDTHGGETIFYYGGGGQGNHLPGAYATATRRALGSRYRSSALAQEKTGEFWVADRMLGAYTRGDFEHCEVAFFLGKNPWFSHSIPQARVTLKGIAKDPARTMIVVDPRRTKTAEMADIHLAVRPGGDAWLLAGMIGVLVQEDLLDTEFLDAYAEGADEIRTAFANTPVATYAERAGVPEAQLREAARVIGRAGSVACFEDLGVQMNVHSTLVSYLHRLLWGLTGNLGKKGAQYIITPFSNIASGRYRRDSPVAGARIIGGLVPCNVIAEEILSDHDKRYRAMIVEASNPAHSLADSKAMREALASLDTLVVIDVAMTETAKLADYVLPASTQYEKAEATFFNAEFPKNYFHLRPALLEAPEGPLPEAEIHARLVDALGALDDELIDRLRSAAEESREAFTTAFTKEVAFNPKHQATAAVILYRTLGEVLPPRLKEGAVLWGLALQLAAKSGPSLARAGFSGPPAVAGNQLFDALVDNPSGIVFAVDEWDDQLGRVQTKSKKLQLALPDLLEELARLDEVDDVTSEAFPLVLSAGERRSFTANTIVRDPAWRKKDAKGALRISPDDAEGLGVSSGDRVRLVTERGELLVEIEVSTQMQPGHISLPNGMGLGENAEGQGGVAPNELTASAWRDPFVGTPWHKRVPARVEALA